MKTYITKTKEVKEVDEIFCNKCGTQCDHTVDKDYGSFSIRWGYYSKKDLEQHNFDLCEDCYDELVTTFVIKPERLEYGISTGEIVGIIEDE